MTANSDSGSTGGDQSHGWIARLEKMEALLLRIAKDVRETRQLVGPFAVPLSADELLVQTLQNIKYVVPTRDLIMTPQLIIYRQWEPELSALLPALCRPGSVFVDVGANFGYHTCLIAGRMGRTPGSKVIAIEPNPDLERLLRINVAINWSGAPVHIEPVAVAARLGEATLHVPDSRIANGSLASGAVADISAKHIQVRTVPLDELVGEEPRIDLIKIDVEGFEVSVLRGGVNTLRRDDVQVVCEWSPQQLRYAGFDPMELPAILRGLGFRLFSAERFLAERGGSEIDDSAIATSDYMNILAKR